MRTGTYANLSNFFGAMRPMALKTLHGYQYFGARQGRRTDEGEQGAVADVHDLPLRDAAGLMEANPFTDMTQNRTKKKVRTIYRGQEVRFCLWAQRQTARYQGMGCADMFIYLTDFRAAELRLFTWPASGAMECVWYTRKGRWGKRKCRSRANGCSGCARWWPGRSRRTRRPGCTCSRPRRGAEHEERMGST